MSMNSNRSKNANPDFPATMVAQKHPITTGRKHLAHSNHHTGEDILGACVSIIIPSCAAPRECLPVLKAIDAQWIRPFEIIVVDSSGSAADDWEYTTTEISSLLLSERLRIQSAPSGTFPGRARNIGCKLAKGDWIAFLDVNTIPAPEWLEASIATANSSGGLGVWGSTEFQATSNFAELLRDGIYGVEPRRTLPGSVFRRSVTEAVGHFIEWVRAAEDTEWIARARTLGLSITDAPKGSIRYIGMASITPTDALHKWWRNYAAAQTLQHLRVQKVIAWLGLYATLVTFAFNWNAIAAGWQTDSPLYIDHVTKIASLAPIWGYIWVRGAWLPHRRGVPWKRLLPLRFMRIASVCLLLDGMKALAFLISGRQVKRLHDSLV
jgi:glycosyltransferase involved in cell wall biosynthesis